MSPASSSLPRRRILCLWLPYLPTDRVERASIASPPAPPEGHPAPLALVAKVEGALRISAVNRAARRAGIAPGLALAAARAMLPTLAALDHDPAADRAQIGRAHV